MTSEQLCRIVLVRRHKFVAMDGDDTTESIAALRSLLGLPAAGSLKDEGSASGKEYWEGMLQCNRPYLSHLNLQTNRF